MDTTADYCVYVLKFRVFEHGTARALEINNNGGLKRKQVESCPPATKNISSLPECLWPPDLVGW